jgi:hypothetical protein
MRLKSVSMLHPAYLQMRENPFKQFPYSNSTDDANHQKKNKSGYQPVSERTAIHYSNPPPNKNTAPESRNGF